MKDYYKQEFLNESKGGFKGDWIVGLALIAIIVLVIVS